ncbi:MAG: phenylpyruvate tautomerase MIF-related protein [Candidatus Aegiribacteria sp.]
MPLIRLETDRISGSENLDDLLEKMSATVAEALGKPLDYVMASVSPSRISLGNRAGDAALVQVMSIGGLDPRVNGIAAVSITELLTAELGLDPERVYVTFTDVPGENWACGGTTFR